ncbi:MAG: DUF309 domain-containing protein [Phormidesmis priestleyi]|uniref:DUF309 domain-containing protein n=1 Tax=Phormidesmis priestleyi TaxID=268141 RepID=A0A2W4X0L6_9CYAN|nr:MAG: DUF309 domain-containing protein [Phormidesmis priestleyi]
MFDSNPSASDSVPDSQAASVPDSQADSLLNPLFIRGINEFNRGEFYACHDTLEAIWMVAETVDKAFYQGVLQIAVAFYHLGNLNWRGGAILLGEGINRLQRFEPSYEKIAVEDLVDQAVEWLSLVQTAGPDGIAALMADLPRPLPHIQWVSA